MARRTAGNIPIIIYQNILAIINIAIFPAVGHALNVLNACLLTAILTCVLVVPWLCPGTFLALAMPLIRVKNFKHFIVCLFTQFTRKYLHYHGIIPTNRL